MELENMKRKNWPASLIYKKLMKMLTPTINKVIQINILKRTGTPGYTQLALKFLVILLCLGNNNSHQQVEKITKTKIGEIVMEFATTFFENLYSKDST